MLAKPYSNTAGKNTIASQRHDPDSKPEDINLILHDTQKQHKNIKVMSDQHNFHMFVVSVIQVYSDNEVIIVVTVLLNVS